MATVRSSSAGPLSSDRIDVLIVGAGPVGLALALQAHAHGAQVKVVERRGTVFRPSRAMILHPRTLESLRPLGVTDALVARAMRSPRIRIHLRAGNRLPNYLVDCNSRRVRLHDLTATPGVHVLLARDAEALDSAASPWLHVHRLDSWPGTGVASVRPDGYLGFSAGSVDSSEVAAWLSRVAVG